MSLLASARIPREPTTLAQLLQERIPQFHEGIAGKFVSDQNAAFLAIGPPYKRITRTCDRCLRKGADRCYAVEGENLYHCIFGGKNCFIVHPSDTAPALVALQASVGVAGPNGRRTVAVENFLMPPAVDYTSETVLEPTEIVTEIVLPPPAQGLRSSYRKVRALRAWDFALAGVAWAVVFAGDQTADSRVVLSGAAPVPRRCTEAGKALEGKLLDRDHAATAAEAALKNAEPMKQNEYNIPLFRGLLEQQLTAIARAGSR
jgi:xanthine dehydrogenase YagS FAD-binding subunit